ncbi:arylsulfatase, partial [bacterium]|nr:arylsulfatase [bacterium]
GKPVFVYNWLALERYRWEGKPLAPGKHTVEFDFAYDGPGFAKGGTGTLKVDNQTVATKTIPATIPSILTIDESLDIGVDTRSPVDDNDYQLPFTFEGTIDKVEFELKD